MTEETRSFMTDYAVPPGTTLQEILHSRGTSLAELARRTSWSLSTINSILEGKAAITLEIALQLERATDLPASFWTNRDRRYRAALARVSEREATDPSC
jgi:addiction module HigA family antidote